MSTITGTPSDMTHIDHHTGYTFYIGQTVFTKSAHGPYNRQTVVRMTATQIILEDEYHTQTRYSIKTRTKHGAVKSMYPSSIVGIVEEPEAERTPPAGLVALQESYRSGHDCGRHEDDSLPAPEDRVIPRGPETEAEELAEHVRSTRTPAPVPEDLHYTVGVHLNSMAELAYLPNGTLLVAERGLHEGTTYRVVYAPGQEPHLTTQRRDGNVQGYALADTVAGDYVVERNNLTVVWLPCPF